MQLSAVHPVPRRADVVREQLAAVGLSLRREAAVGAGALSLLVMLELWNEGSRLERGVVVDPEFLIPIMLVALLAPMAVWKGEGPEARSYHRAMPIPGGEHALIRSLSGLVWTAAAMLAYAASQALLAAVTGGYIRQCTPVEWAGPVVAALVLYLLASAVSLMFSHPWRWIGGGGVAYVFLRTLTGPLDRPLPLYTVIGPLMDWRYGFRTLATGLAPVPDVRLVRSFDLVLDDRVVNTGAWLTATWIWMAAAVALFLWAAYRQPER